MFKKVLLVHFEEEKKEEENWLQKKCTLSIIHSFS